MIWFGTWMGVVSINVIFCVYVLVLDRNGWNNGNNDDDAAEMNAEKTVIEY